MGELELAWRLVDAEVIAVTGTNGKTTTVELLGEIHRAAGEPVRVVGNVGTAYASLAGVDLARRRRRLRGVVLPARGHGGVRARGGDPAEPRARPPRPPRHAGGLPRRQAPGLRAPGARGHRARAHRRARRGPPGGRRWRSATARSCTRGSGSTSACAGRTTSRTPPRPPPSRWPAASIRARGSRRSPASSTGSRRSIASTASSTSTTRRPRTSHRRSSRSPRSPRRCTSSSAGRARARTSRRCAAAAADARVYLIGEDAERIGEAVGGERAATSRRPSRGLPRGAREGDVVLLSPACASFDQFADYEARGRASRSWSARVEAPGA